MDGILESAEQSLAIIASDCIECGLCLGECGFLRRQGLPKMVAERTLAGETLFEIPAFSCSLCGLCAEICPRHLPIPKMYLLLRRKAVDRGCGGFRQHRPLRAYQWLGKSPLFRAAFIPEGCRTVFFPGCALPGIFPGQLFQTVGMLRNSIPHLGVVLDCCSKPSHDLGDREGFNQGFSHLQELFKHHGIDHIITGCPSCFQLLQRYGEPGSCSMLYRHLDNSCGSGNCDGRAQLEQWTVHDPCSIRKFQDEQQVIRDCAANLGLAVTEMAHHGPATICCGEGGAASMFDPRECSDWRRQRIVEARGKRMLTWCAGCTIKLRDAGACHFLELLFAGGQNKKRWPPKLARPPLTYLNRLLFKWRLWRIYTSTGR